MPQHVVNQMSAMEIMSQGPTGPVKQVVPVEALKAKLEEVRRSERIRTPLVAT